MSTTVDERSASEQSRCRAPVAGRRGCGPAGEVARRRLGLGLAGLLAGCSPGLRPCCDPVVNVYGSYWPGWLVSLFAGAALAAACRQLLAWSRIEPHLGPLIVVYPSLVVLLAVLAWIVLFQG